MTDLQVRYWQQQEQARSNRAQEALKSRSEDIHERSVSIDEQKLDYEIQRLIADIDRIQAETAYTEEEKMGLLAERWKTASQALKETLGAIMSGYSFMSLFA